MAKSEEDKITRREAVKRMGLMAAGIGLGLSGASAILPGGNNYNRKNMKVLLVNGSPHKQGCTYTALSEVGKALEAEVVAT